MNNIREAHIEDAKSIINHIKKVSDETDFLVSASDERELNVKKEEEFLQNIQKYIYEKIFIYEIDEKIVGLCTIKGVNKKRIKHRVNLGITTLKEYWGLGIAKDLINYVIDYCKSNSIRKIELYVRVDNERALNLYKKLGFCIECEIKDFFCIDGIYYNSYMMPLFI